MLKTAVPSERSSSEETGDGKGGDGLDSGSVKIARKSGKSKRQKTFKSQKSAKSWKSSKSRKDLSKSGNSPNFGATETRPSFLTPKARSAFNHLRLTFTEALILQYFNPECHIRIETDALGYAIGDVLSQLTSGICLDGIITKTNLGQ